MILRVYNQHIFCILFVIIVQGVLHLLPKISMFCALSQNNQQLFEKQIMRLIKNVQGTQMMALKLK